MTGTGRQRQAAWVPFGYGFRPFFLLAGLYALVSVAAWVWFYRNGGWPLRPLPPQHWHGHEMIFGFISAAMAGFLLTAVPSWTGSRGFAGLPLVALVVLWLAGRIVFFLGNAVPLHGLAFAELAFMPALIGTIAATLFRSANRNRPLLLLLVSFWAADAAFVYGLSEADAALSRAALGFALDVVLVLITIIGGRIVPAFTGNALRAAGASVSLRSRPLLERLVIIAMIAFALADLLTPSAAFTAVVAAAAAALQLWRLAGWKGWLTGSQPIVWVLHVAYAWLPVGLALKAAWIAGGFAWAAHWQHALGAGAATTMILAVMTRAALGHTGRALRAHPSIAMAYGLLVLSVIVRVFGPALLPQHYAAVVLAAGGLWLAAFVPYLVVYAPILLRARVDGKPG